MALLSDNELRQSAKQLIRRLWQCNGYLERIDQEPVTEHDWRLMSARNNYSRPVALIASQLVKELLVRDWLVAAPSGLLRVGNAARKLWSNGSELVEDNALVHQTRFSTSRLVAGDTGARRRVLANSAENPLAWLRHHKDKSGQPFITQVHLEAGERLREDYTVSCLESAITTDWSAFLQMSGVRRARRTRDISEPTEKALAARQRFYKACRAIGPEMAPIAIEICCLSRGLEDRRAPPGLCSQNSQTCAPCHTREACRTL